MILSPPGDVYIRRTVHNCIIQLSKVGEHYDIQKFVKFSTLRVRKNAVHKYDFCIFMVKLTTFNKQLSKNIYLLYSLYVTVRSLRDCGGLFVVYSAISFRQTSDLLSLSE